MNNKYLVLLTVLIITIQGLSKDLKANQQLARSSSAYAVNRFFDEFTEESVCYSTTLFNYRSGYWAYIRNNETMPVNEVEKA